MILTRLRHDILEFDAVSVQQSTEHMPHLEEPPKTDMNGVPEPQVLRTGHDDLALAVHSLVIVSNISRCSLESLEPSRVG